MKEQTVETLIQDLSDELVCRLDGSERYSEIRISYLKRAIKELKEIKIFDEEELNWLNVNFVKNILIYLKHFFIKANHVILNVVKDF